jgi:hypothetical protein
MTARNHKGNHMNPAANDPFHYAAVADTLQVQATDQPAPAELSLAEAPIAQAVVETAAAPLEGEVLPPETPAPQTPPSVPQYPIGLIDFNLPILVVDSNDDEEMFDTPSIVTVLKGSLHPVVISFWKSGEQCIDQFDTDGDSLSGDHKVEQDQPYPRTLFVVVGREGRNLVLDPDLYVSEEAANDETTIDDIAGIFPVVIQAKVEEPVAEPVSDFNDDGVESDEQSIEEEGEEEIEDTEEQAADTDQNLPPTEMYVAGRMRRVGDTVYATRKNFGVRECTVTKLRRDATKSLCLQPKDGSAAYWAWNSHVRY